MIRRLLALSVIAAAAALPIRGATQNTSAPRVPFVKRVIFVATPNRGSYQALGFLGSVASWLVNLPGRFAQLSFDLLTHQKQGVLLGPANGVSTSIRPFGIRLRTRSCPIGSVAIMKLGIATSRRANAGVARPV